MKKGERSTHLLWKAYFRDPSICCYNPYKHSSRLADFQHRFPDVSSSWIDGCYTNPSWVLNELLRRRATDEMLTTSLDEQSLLPKKEESELRMIITTENAREDIVIVELLKTCSKKKDIYTGNRLHAEILRRGLHEKNPYIACSLISMFVKCGALGKAEAVHAELPMHDTVSWNALISGYIQEGKGHEALHSFESMQKEGLSPNGVTFICILKACGSMGDVDKGKKIHEEIVGRGLLEKNVVIGNALVDMYTKCGILAKARQVLLDLPVRNVVSWSTLIAGYAQMGQGHDAISCFELMQREGISPNDATFLCTLKACATVRAIGKGEQIHEEIMDRGLLKKNIMLGNALVDMYAKCGVLTKAQQVLNELPARNVVCWSALIAGYTQEGQGHEALNCFVRMQQEGISSNEIVFVCVLKACGSTRAINTGRQIHEEIINKGLLKKNIVLGNALVDMYVKCGVLEKAQQLLEELPVRNAISWSSLISGLAHQGQGHEALNCFERMKREGISPDGVTFACVLKACGSIGALDKGGEIHDEILNRGLLKESLKLGTALVDMYVKCGMLSKAREVVEELPVQNAVSWSVLISGYAQQGRYHEALGCFEQMQKEELYPDGVTFTSVLMACGSIGAVYKGKQIHNEIINRDLLKENVVLGNALVDMYVKFGMLSKAREILEELPAQNIISWNTLITGYVQYNQGHEAMDCFAKVKQKGISPDGITFAYILKACGILGAINVGEELHDEIVRRGFLKGNLVIGTALVDMYAKCGMLSKAWQVFEELYGRDIVSWTALIAGYAQAGQGHQALNCLELMQKEGLYPNEVTFTCILNACSSIGAIDVGKQIHKEILDRGFLEKYIVLGNALVDMYAKCGMLVKAKQLLEKLPIRNVATWNALVEGYAQEEKGHAALDCFEQMKREGVSPDEVTFVCILKACGSIGGERIQKLHNELVNRGLLEKSIIVGNTLLSLYAKCGEIAKARKVFESLPVRNAVSWNILIAGYAQTDQGHEAFKCFECMQTEGLSPDEATFVSILNACTKTGAIEKGKKIHDDILSTGLLDKSMVLGSALVSMYAKCGLLAKAQQVLEALRYRDTVCWSALITGYAQERHGHEALNCFTKMQREGHSPDDVTFLCVLKACCHVGKLDDAQTYYENMSRKYGILPNLQHLTCMVVIYGCAGQFDKAISVVKTMAATADPSAWVALLTISRKWGNLKLGKLGFEQMTQHEKNLELGICSEE